MARPTIEEKNKSYKEFIIKYLSKDTWHDYEGIAKLQDTPTLKKLADAEKFIQENMSEQTYADFLKKAYPLEQYNKDELKYKVTELAKAINSHEAGLIDILDTVGNLHKYAYMVKQLRFKYGTIGATIYQSNCAYIDTVSLYNKPEFKLTSSYGNISQEDENKLRQIVKDRGLMLNNATYTAAYLYARRNKLININSNVRK